MDPKKKEDFLAEEMSRFEQEVLGGPSSVKTSNVSQPPPLMTRPPPPGMLQDPNHVVQSSVPLALPHGINAPLHKPIAQPTLPLAQPHPGPFPGAVQPLLQHAPPPSYAPLQQPAPLLPQQPAHPAPQPRMPAVNPSAVLEMSEGLVKAAKQEAKRGKQKRTGKRQNMRCVGGMQWEDPTLEEWDPNDYRIFCGDLANDVNDEILARAFRQYPSFLKAKIVRDKHSQKSRGYGFVSFKDPHDFMNALKEMNGKYIGTRPVKLRKSTWKERSLEMVRKKDRERAKLGMR